MRGGLHHGDLLPGRAHIGKVALELDRLGGRLAVRVLLESVSGLDGDRGDEPGSEAGGGEDLLDEGDRAALSVRPGNSDDIELPGRMIVEDGGNGGESRSRAGNDHEGNIGRDSSGRLGPLDHDGGRAPGDCVPDVVMPVDVEAGDGHEETALGHRSRVVADRGDERVAGAADFRRLRFTEQD